MRRGGRGLSVLDEHKTFLFVAGFIAVAVLALGVNGYFSPRVGHILESTRVSVDGSDPELTPARTTRRIRALASEDREQGYRDTVEARVAFETIPTKFARKFIGFSRS